MGYNLMQKYVHIGKGCMYNGRVLEIRQCNGCTPLSVFLSKWQAPKEYVLLLSHIVKPWLGMSSGRLFFASLPGGILRFKNI